LLSLLCKVWRNHVAADSVPPSSLATPQKHSLRLVIWGCPAGSGWGLVFDKVDFVCSVNTPTKTRGVGAGKAADLTYWEGAARMIASVSKTSKIVIEKSTVPVKTAEAIEKVYIDA